MTKFCKEYKVSRLQDHFEKHFKKCFYQDSVIVSQIQKGNSQVSTRFNKILQGIMRLDLEMIVIIMSWCAPALQHHFVKHFKSAFIEILKLLAEFQNMIKKISTRFSKEL